MSTKTTLKRLALVAVSAMGFGLLSAVPSSAATISSLTVGTLPAARVGETATVAVTVNMTANATSTDTITVAAKAVAAPTQGGLANAASQFAASTADTNESGAVGKQRLWFSNAAGNLGAQIFTAITTSERAADGDNYAGTFVTGVTAAGALAAGGTAAGVPAASTTVATGALLTKTVYLSFRPDVAGTYTFLVSADDSTGTATGANFSYVAGDISTTFSITVGSVAPAKVVLTRIGGTPSPTGSLGSLIKVSLQDAAGLPATITGDEAVTITTSSGTITKATVSSGSFATGSHVAGTTSVSLVPANLINGVGFVNVKAAAEAVATITASGDGSLSSGVTNAISVTFGKAATATGNTFVGADGTAVTTGWYLASGTAASGTWNVPTTATSSTLEFTHTAIAVGGTALAAALTVVDTSGKISSSGGAGANTIGYDQAYTRAASGLGYTTVSISHAAIGAGEFDLVDSAGGLTSGATVAGAAAAFTNGTLTATPSTVRMATGGSVSIKAILKNQYGVALANTSVTVTVAGRNSAKASQTLVTDSTGYITYSFTDTGTTGTSDVITLNGGNAATTTTVSVVYSSVAVGTVTVTGGASEDIAPTVTRTAISTGNIGETTTGAVAFTATVEDADGNPLAGVPVTFSVDKGLITKTATVDYTTVYTDAAGEATTYAFNWLIEKQTVTATAGGVTGTGYANWAAETASTARVLTAEVSGNTVTFTAVDRFGNPVNGVAITLSRTGSGYFGTGSSTATATTDRTGTVQVQFTGAGTVTGELATTSQGYTIAGSATSLATGAYKAAVAGTTTGTGVSFAPAGVGSVTVTVEANSDSATTAASAAADAAAEATDAANAATDAANAAAEAADAATAAAQDAADAVAALSTQVATYISNLRKQITALTNLVIKIQKKVNA